MRSSPTILAILSLAVVIGGAGGAVAAEGIWQQRVAQALGKSGTEMPGGVYRVGLPRTDLDVTLDGVKLKPGFALGGWLAFAETHGSGMVMGDVVLTAEEVNPVMKKLLESGIEVTGLHNHLLRNQPSTMYMHVLGHGDPGELAAAMREALTLSRTPLAAAPSGGSQQPAALDLDTTAIDKALGAKGKNVGGVYQFGIARAKPISEGGMAIPTAMGTANAINFQPTGGGRAAITGDFVLTAKEVSPVAKALREHGIEVTALHNHMLGEAPRLFFLHFWANDDAKKLAAGLKAALANIDIANG